MRDLLLAVVLVDLLELVRRLGDAVADERLLVHHLLALLHLRHALELREHALGGAAGVGPDVGLGLVRAVDDGARVDPAERAQLAHLLHQPLLALLERGLSGRVVRDEG